MELADLVFIYGGLSVMCLFGVYGGYKGKIRLEKNPVYYPLMLFACIVLNFIVLGNLLYHSRYIPGEQKGALYGSLAGASFGGVLFSIMISAALFGMSIRMSRPDRKGVPDTGSDASQYAYPAWFTRFSVSLISTLAGMMIGAFLVGIIKKGPFEEMAVWAFAIATGISGLFLLGFAAFVVQKYVLKR